jgi:hypothetical protein
MFIDGGVMLSKTQAGPMLANTSGIMRMGKRDNQQDDDVKNSRSFVYCASIENSGAHAVAS